MLSQKQPGHSAFPYSRSEADVKPVRYAIIGSGMMGHEHIRNIALLPGASVTAVADPDEGMRTTASDLAGPGCAAFADYREMLSASEFDALLIASPNHTHVDVLSDVMRLDKPILVEKPLCTTLEDCRKVLAMQEARSAPVWVAMEYRFMPPVQRLLKGVHEGAAGHLKMISIREHRFPFLKKVGDWNRFNAKTGGTLVEKCCHFFDLMRLIAQSEPVRVYASGGADVNFLDEEYPEGRPDILDNAFVVVDFANGVRAMLDLCMFAEGSYWQEIISATGDEARIDAFIPGPSRFSPDGRERHSEIAISPRATKRELREEVEVDEAVLAAGDHHGSTYFQHAKFIDLVRHGGVPEVSLEDGLKAVMIGAAAEESARTHRAVEL
ncbi:Gfo/Idh/MocA family oxidoreductase [Rhizobiales bacterium]|uniref:Gfo/Idh/MocA family protein n=1 Tax=Hongsoonwoonella zoysiae TaxID=2821844 RepID=UPI001560AD63|nr:Gfo/Idh/MocA family oxidoreductase [Hongsoonwoonella zoysiae]NRG19276.1 Gfo/Idh/MocA family oxidoreductase [Hongsoonwoonella zoysiae]